VDNSRRGKVNESEYGLRYFLYMYECVTLKSVEVILRRGVLEEGE
jgi:hypothetical protein